MNDTTMETPVAVTVAEELAREKTPEEVEACEALMAKAATATEEAPVEA